jgi:hypothetical protein
MCILIYLIHKTKTIKNSQKSQYLQLAKSQNHGFSDSIHFFGDLVICTNCLLKLIFLFQPPSWFFCETLFPQNLRLINIKWIQKEDWKNVGYSQSYTKKNWSAILNWTAIFDIFDKICSQFMLLTKIQTHCKKPIQYFCFKKF